jgi:hypothetical protein
VLARAVPAEANCVGEIDTKFFPLPVWATDPNEGQTWGAMPVFFGVCPDASHTAWIFAPSVTWNSVIHLTGTLRWFQYPDPDSTLIVIASGSTHINYQLSATWLRLPAATGKWTDEAVARVQRTVFERFFGFGPDTPQGAETSYTLSRALITERRGLNVGRNINVGVIVGIERDAVGNEGVPGLPLTRDVFPNVPGIRGATLLSQGLDVRYDDRINLNYAERGLRLDLWGSVVEGVSNSPTFLRGGAEARAIWPELSMISGAARVLLLGSSSRDAPFYQQSELGGALLLRGFAEGRFVDHNAWTVEAEQRIRVLQTHFYGVTTDWRIDPFVAAGQVFGSAGEMVSNPRLSVGVGLRAFIRPSVLGRVDLAYGGEGLKIYVELGSPY